MKKSVHMIVSGRVQGVGFRYFTLSCAESAGVKGTVQNKSDGTVEIYAEARPAAIDRFYSMVRKAPALGRVDDVKITTIPEYGYTSFRII
ncbi:MAG TPA: acylphosphatase [Spirochaetota bacterium]|nr:acylphosphatase [Spirochaetota bacterium]